MTIAPPARQRRSQARSTPQRSTTVGAPATAGQRAGAYLIDIAIVALIGAVIWFATGSLVLVSVAVIELWAIGWVWEGHTGATPGNLICGIRTVQKGADVSVGARRLFPRSLVLGLAHIVPVLLPVGLTASGLLDGLAGARVIDVRKTRQAVAGGVYRAPDLEARVVGTGSSTSVTAEPGVITQTPLTPPPAPGVIAQAPGAPAPAQAPAAQAPAPASAAPLDAGGVPVFELSDGTVIQTTGLGFIGRAPRAPESIPDAILIRVPDGSRSLSRTHAAFGVEDDQLWVQDLGSANGASVRHLDGSVTQLAPHVPRFLAPGDFLVLGGDAELAFRRVAGRGARPDSAGVPSAERQIAQEATPPAVPQAAPVVAPPSVAAPAAVPPAPQAVAPGAAHAQPAAPIPATTPAPQAALVGLQFADGTTVPVRGLGYIGRAPRLPEGEHPEAALIAVPNGDRSVSRTHGRFGVVDGQTWFEDLGSGNGSSLRTADGRTGPMTPHQRFVLVPGLTLQLGDCVIRVIAL